MGEALDKILAQVELAPARHPKTGKFMVEKRTGADRRTSSADRRQGDRRAAPAAAPTEIAASALGKVLELAERTFSTDTRDKLASKGAAMPDGSFPIPDKDALRRAIQSFGRAPEEKKAAVKAHIKKRAEALGATDMLPEDW